MADNWFECRPGFTIPNNVQCSQYAPYDDLDINLPEFGDVIVIGDMFRVPKWAWGTWYDAQRRDVIPKLSPGLLTAIADRTYEAQRYKAMVPEWRRWMVEALTEIDDIEDQVSTVLWMVELVGRKFLPIPRGVLSSANKVRRMLDDASNLLAGVQLSRKSKAEWKARQADIRRQKRKARSKLAKLMIWMKQNYGRLLEAGQATNTWFDVGIVLGPIFAFIEEGVWSLVAKTRDNYLIGVDAFIPGYGDDFRRQVKLMNDGIGDELIGVFETAKWGVGEFFEFPPGPAFPFRQSVRATADWIEENPNLSTGLLTVAGGAAVGTLIDYFTPATPRSLDTEWQRINDTFGVGPLVSDEWLSDMIDPNAGVPLLPDA